MKNQQLKVLVLLLVIASGCYYDHAELLYPGSTVDCTTTSAKYADVSPIISAKCATAGCHNAASAAGGTVLETYAQIKAKADRIHQRTVVERTMPPGTGLTALEYATIKCWLSSGAPQ